MSEAAEPAPQRAAPARLFNFETMSGVFPGTRTQVFQRVRLRDSGDAAGTATEWAQIFWSEEPPACLVAPLEMESGRTGAPLVQLEAPLQGELGLRLRAALAVQGKRLATCGACLHWQPAAERSADGLPLGACRLRRADERIELPLDLAVQSMLALDCPHWLEAPLQTSDAGAAPVATPADAPALPTAPLPRQAVITESKKPWLTRMTLRMRRALVQASPHAPTQPLVERSGVGAGTEPCFACQGRIANLGALTVASNEGDKQTFSVWRCRLCYTLYLSDWIDRWERVDSLETEETIYRIAPVEAAELLALIGSVQGGDHPRLRAERGAQRAWVLEQVARRPVLSHVIKQGR